MIKEKIEQKVLKDYLSKLLYVRMHVLAQLKTGKVDFNDEYIQSFIPVAVSYVDFEWMEALAENMCSNQDKEIIIDFFRKIDALNRSIVKNKDGMDLFM